MFCFDLKQDFIFFSSPHPTILPQNKLHMFSSSPPHPTILPQNKSHMFSSLKFVLLILTFQIKEKREHRLLLLLLAWRILWYSTINLAWQYICSASYFTTSSIHPHHHPHPISHPYPHPHPHHHPHPHPLSHPHPHPYSQPHPHPHPHPHHHFIFFSKFLIFIIIFLYSSRRF